MFMWIAIKIGMCGTSVPSFGPSGNGGLKLEDNVSFILLEDNISFLLME